MRAAHAASLVSHAHAERIMRPAYCEARNALCAEQITKKTKGKKKKKKTKKRRRRKKKKRRRRRRATCAGPGRDGCALSEDER